MKSKVILLLIVIIVLVFQGLRIFNWNQLSPLENKEPKTISKEEIVYNGEMNFPYLIVEGTGDQSKKITASIESAFDFKGINYNKVSLEKFQSLSDSDIFNYQMIIITSESYQGYQKNSWLALKDYVESGGIIAFGIIPYTSPFNNYIGIESVEGYQPTEGLEFKRNISIGLEPEYNDLYKNLDLLSGSSLDLRLGQGVEELVTSNEVPLAFTKKISKGKILGLNSTFFSEKRARGLLSQLLLSQPAYSLEFSFNAKVLHIDDFPMPVPRGSYEQIAVNYAHSTPGFYKNVWWEDMKDLAIKHDLKFSNFFIGTYGYETARNTTSSVAYEELESTWSNIEFFTRASIQRGDEVALHGYNHLPLMLEGEVDKLKKNFIGKLEDEYPYDEYWSSSEDIEKAYDFLKEKLNYSFGKNFEIYSYVPPSNILSPEMIPTLIKSFPQITNIASVYDGGGIPWTYEQEIGRDNKIEGLYHLPRFSSGFLETDKAKWSIVNAINGYGIFSHFIHPDDLLDEERGQGKSWDELFFELDNIVSFVDTLTQGLSLEPLTQQELADYYIANEDVRVISSYDGTNIQLTFNNVPQNENSYFILRLNGNRLIESVSEGSYLLVDKTPYYKLYLLNINTSQLNIELGAGL